MYKTVGGAPHLDQNYTVFGHVVRGLDVVDRIASVPTSKAEDRDRPLTDVRILHARLIRRKH
jgi:peptidyl-prolyl cis-trans isomerase B (cyclophilin B)